MFKSINILNNLIKKIQFLFLWLKVERHKHVSKYLDVSLNNKNGKLYAVNTSESFDYDRTIKI